MVWVKSEYAGELAVVSAWISALLPWYLSYVPRGGGPFGTSAVVFRWPLLQIRYFPGLSFSENVQTFPVTLPWEAKAIGFDATALAYDVWLLGAAVVGLAVVLSVAMYVDLDRVAAALPFPPVRVMGALLALAGLVLAAAAGLFAVRSPVGEYPLPVGAAIVLVLGASLLRIELLGDGDDRSGDDPEVASEDVADPAGGDGADADGSGEGSGRGGSVDGTPGGASDSGKWPREDGDAAEGSDGGG